MIVNLTSITNIDDILVWLEENPDKAKWVHGRPIFYEEGRIYISGIEFFNIEDCLFYSLKFGLSRLI